MNAAVPPGAVAAVLQVCTGAARQVRVDGRTILTAIGKQAVAYDAKVDVGRLGLHGDEQADTSRHGGLSKAVYLYPSEHLPFWQTVRAQARVALWDEPLPPGLFGENLLTRGLRESDLWIGDRLRLPDCVLAVSEPRMPCFKLNAALGFKHAGKLMQESGFCGAYLTVIEAGSVRPGDPIDVLPGPRDVNLRELFRARAGR